MPKVCLFGGSRSYEKMFTSRGWSLTESIVEADLIQFTGGEDVSPELYNETKHPTTHSNTARDKFEISVFERSTLLGKKMAGICRGGQFLNVMCGGRLWQHVDNHALSTTHKCIDLKSRHEHNVTSTHHQMMQASYEGVVIATALESTVKESCVKGVVNKLHQLQKGNDPDQEVVYYPDKQVLCFQPHPEYHAETADYYFYLLGTLLEL